MGRILKRTDTPAGITSPVEFQGDGLRGLSLPETDVDASRLDELSVSALINFFRVLDRWDRESKPPC
jgi:hypothetical protein